MRIITTTRPCNLLHPMPFQALFLGSKIGALQEERSEKQMEISPIKMVFMSTRYGKMFCVPIECTQNRAAVAGDAEELLPEASFAWTDVLIIHCACVQTQCRRAPAPTRCAASNYSIFYSRPTQCRLHTQIFKSVLGVFFGSSSQNRKKILGSFT